jgi:hypothetical protein
MKVIPETYSVSESKFVTTGVPFFPCFCEVDNIILMSGHIQRNSWLLNISIVCIFYFENKSWPLQFKMSPHFARQQFKIESWNVGQWWHCMNKLWEMFQRFNSTPQTINVISASLAWYDIPEFVVHYFNDREFLLIRKLLAQWFIVPKLHRHFESLTNSQS